VDRPLTLESSWIRAFIHFCLLSNFYETRFLSNGDSDSYLFAFFRFLFSTVMTAEIKCSAKNRSNFYLRAAKAFLLGAKVKFN
jgi:hypothetical protein